MYDQITAGWVYLVPPMLRRFGPNYPRVFAAAMLQELAFSLLIHFPGYLSGLGATEAMIGLLYSASAVVSIVFRPWLGRILDLTHRRTVLLVIGVLNFTTVLLFVTTSVWGPLIWGLFIAQRTFQIAIFATMLTYGADSIPIEKRTQGLAIFGLSGLIPISFAGVIGDFLIDTNGFDALFIAAGLSGLMSWLIVWTLPVLPVMGRQPRRGFWQALVQKNMLPLWFASFLFALGVESLFTFTRTFVDDRQVGTTGLFFGIYGASAALTRIVGGSRYDLLPHRALLVGSISMLASGLIVLAFTQSVFLMVIAAFVTGTAHGVSFPLLSSEVVNRARVNERGSAMSIFTSIFDFALLLGAPLVGLMIDGVSYTLAFSVTGVALILGSITYVFWDKRMLATDSSLVGEEILE